MSAFIKGKFFLYLLTLMSFKTHVTFSLPWNTNANIYSRIFKLLFSIQWKLRQVNHTDRTDMISLTCLMALLFPNLFRSFHKTSSCNVAHGFWWVTVFSFVLPYQQLCWLNLQCLDLLALFRSQRPLLPLPGVPHLPELGSGEDAVVLAGPQSTLRHTRSRCHGELYDIPGQIFHHNVFIYKQSQNSLTSKYYIKIW